MIMSRTKSPLWSGWDIVFFFSGWDIVKDTYIKGWGRSLMAGGTQEGFLETMDAVQLMKHKEDLAICE